MSIRQHHSVSNNSVPFRLNHPHDPSNSYRNQNPLMTYVPRPFSVTDCNRELFAASNFYKNESSPAHLPVNVPNCFVSSVNTNFNRMPNSASSPARFPVPSNQIHPQSVKLPMGLNCNSNPGNMNPFENNTGIPVNIYQKNFSYPAQSGGISNLPGASNYEGYRPYPIPPMPRNDMPQTFHPFSQNSVPATRNSVNFMNISESNIISLPENVSSSVTFSESSLTVSPSVINMGSLKPVQMLNNCPFNVPPPVLETNAACIFSSNDLLSNSNLKEVELCAFLTKFSLSEKCKQSQITIPEFRSVLKAAFSLMKLLIESKCKLASLVEAEEKEWNSELQTASNLQNQMSEICSIISAPVHLNAVMKKLNSIKKKRELKKKTKLNKLSQKIKTEQNREELNQEIDKYLDDIKEKNLKLKREVEMKKEADYILLEVRKKIHEAKRTIEKIKAFEKLRSARQGNASQKGLHVLPDHNEKFEKKVAFLKATMLKQLADYEAEEKALKVMLETEQEGQLEEEAQWKLKKAKTRQQMKKNHIMECLFGNSEDPMPSDPLFLFHKYQTSANNSVENLVQIRHHWDVHLSEDGEALPRQWVVPVAPSNSSWEKYLATSAASKS